MQITAEWLTSFKSNWRWFSPAKMSNIRFRRTRTVKPKITDLECCKHTRYQKHYPQTAFLVAVTCHDLMILGLFPKFGLGRTCANFWKRVFIPKILERFAVIWKTGFYVNLSPLQRGMTLIEMIITWPVFSYFLESRDSLHAKLSESEQSGDTIRAVKSPQSTSSKISPSLFSS